MSRKYRFFDGRTGAAHDIDIVVSEGRITGIAPSKETLLRWMVDDIRVIQKPASGRDGIVTNILENKARLHLDEATINALSLTANGGERFLKLLSNPAALVCFLAAVAIFIVFLISQLLLQVSPILAHNFPRDWEEKLGDQAFSFLAGNRKICSDSNGQQALQKIISRLGLEAEDKLREIVVVQSHFPNAFAIPGGTIVIYSGMIRTAESPAEIAGIIAHEMGHIALRHPTERLIRESGFALIIRSMFGNVTGTDFLAGTGQKMLQLSYSRDQERQADNFALEILKEHRISPSGMLDSFTRMKNENPALDSNFLSYFSTHPSFSERSDNASKYADDLSYISIISDTEWDELQKICKS